MTQNTNPTETDQLPEHDVIGILLRQHTRIRDLFTHAREAHGEHRQQTFDELRALLAAHETAEEMVLRPFTAAKVAKEVADAHNAEEDRANHVLVDLEDMDVDSPDFEETFAEFESAVLAHAAHEEANEFPFVEQKASPEQLRRMGRALLAAERVAPTHPHPRLAGSPTAQWTVGPFASLLDRARDAVRAVTS